MPNEPKMRKSICDFRPSLKALAEKAAERDQRSLTGLIEKLLVDYLRSIGLLKK